MLVPGGGARPDPGSRRPQMLRRARFVLAGLVAATIVSLALVGAGAGPAGAQSPPPTVPSATTPAPAPAPTTPASPSLITPLSTYLPATVAVSTTGKLRPIPSSFLGFSTEYWSLPVDSQYPSLFGRILSDLKVPGQGLVLRIGGNSADQSFFDPAVTSYPGWAFGLTTKWMQNTAELVAANHLHVILDVNYITGTPQLAAGLVAEAERVFPAGSIIGIEIGNEVDLYTQAGWKALVGSSTVGSFSESDLPATITPESYTTGYAAFARALAPVAPHVPLLAPALARPAQSVNWIQALEEKKPHQGLGEITVHEYPYGDCNDPSGAAYPSVAKLLSPQAVDAMYSSIRPAVAEAHHGHLPLRLTEFNSVTCGGVNTVSNSFATALWAPGAIFEMLSAGASAADLHLRTTPINAPFVYQNGGVSVRPLLYGLMLFQRMLGRGAQLADVQVKAGQGLGLTAWAVKLGSGQINVLLLDKDRRGARVTLKVPGAAKATVQTLIAPSANSVGDVTLEGQQLDAQAQWQGPRRPPTITGSGGTLHVRVRGISAALVSIPAP